MNEEHFRKILCVCVGNICRSPMAAAFLSHVASGLGLGLVAESAGLAALAGEPPDALAIALMKEKGIDISTHRARQFSPQLARPFDLILVMERRHKSAVEQAFPAAKGRVHRLGRFGDFDIPDPYRKPRAAFEASLALIERGIEDFIRAFWSTK